MAVTHYESLGLTCEATPDEIKRRYRKLARLFHPDMHQDAEMREYAETQMRALNAAYEVLSQPKSRTQYDRQLGAQEQGGVADAAAMHFAFADELARLGGLDSNEGTHSICTHLEQCLLLTGDPELTVNAKMILIDLLVNRSDAFAAAQQALQNAQRLCEEVWTEYPKGSQPADDARMYHLRAAALLGGRNAFKQSLDSLVANIADPEKKAIAFAFAAAHFRFQLQQFDLAIAMYEMAYATAADRALKGNACYEMARCYDSDLMQYGEARQWYRRCICTRVIWLSAKAQNACVPAVRNMAWSRAARSFTSARTTSGRIGPTTVLRRGFAPLPRSAATC